MVESEMGNLVDKLAEKLNVAVDQIKPVAEQTVAQFQTRAIVLCIVDFAIFCVTAVLTILFVRMILSAAPLMTHGNDTEEVGGAKCFIGGVAGFITVLLTCMFLAKTLVYLGCAIAPLPSILGL
jgi:hypothetical protein